MTHVQQPPRSKLCGPACVAILAGVTLNEAIVGTGNRRSGSRERHLRAACQSLGLTIGAFHKFERSDTSPRGGPLLDLLDGPLLCRLRWRDRPNGYHWIVIKGSYVYDPAFPEAERRRDYRQWMNRQGAYLSSWAEVS